MRALITGAAGQLGSALVEAVPSAVELVALDRRTLDITDEEEVRRCISGHSPDVVFNAAAYTAVDRAEEERAAVWSVNGDAVGHLAREAVDVGAHLIHVSTDFVFDGTATQPYGPAAKTKPLSEYGASKLEGESQALESSSTTVVRASRLFSGHDGNFATTMLRKMRAGNELSVVDDQVGSPTGADGLAAVLWRFAVRPDLTGIWHWSDRGSCTWYEWALAIQQQSIERGLLDRAVPIEPVPTSGYRTRAARPAYSVLDSSATCAALGIEQVPWEDSLGTMLDQMATPTSS